MPELPEVETIRRDLEKSVVHYTFSDVRIHDPFVLRTPPAQLTKALLKQSITKVERRGKVLLIGLSSRQYLMVQLMMTGQLVIDGKVDKHTRVSFNLVRGGAQNANVGNARVHSLQYNDQRKFGRLQIVTNLKDIKHFSILGPEPFGTEFSPDYIFQYTRGLKKPVKNLLLDHTFVAGIGNIYACEILFRCRIHPAMPSGRITLKQAKELYRQTVDVLNEAILHRGSSMRNYLDASGQKGSFTTRMKVYARQGKACVNCNKPIERLVQAGRSTFFCKHCQKSGRT